MAIPRKRIMAITVGVWLAAAGSAAALTYELNRPLVEHPSPAANVPGTSAASPLTLTDRADARESFVLQLPPITIVGPVPHRPLATRAEKKARDISAMRCAEWRDLDMGSGHVQVCQ
ncbi:MAG TPA: hypothetical protein VGY54_18815 [Polyangiaceae bacterium]|jgi:hypothetical protein|nr:hypothetical protein [Polyangiaceae bacterium]